MAGARIFARGEANESGAGSGDEAVSGPAGEFTVKLPAGTRTVSFAVLAAGYAIRLLTFPLGTEPAVEVPLEAAGGTLVFDLGEHALSEVLQAGTVLLVHGGTFISLQEVAWWTQLLRVAQTDPHRLVLPNMEPGEYLLCVGSAAQAAMPGTEAPAALCDRGSLAPLQELLLSLPAPPGISLRSRPPGSAGLRR